ncbi:hypothetical protein ACQY0O_000830 [Thecaphora frezii]
MEFNTLSKQRQGQPRTATDPVAASSSASTSSSSQQPSDSRPTGSQTAPLQSAPPDATADAPPRSDGRPASAASATMASAHDGLADGVTAAASTAEAASLTASAVPPSTVPGMESEPTPSATSDTKPSAEAEEEALREHNLIRATQLLQGAASPSPFAPSPILRLNSIRIVGASALRPSFLATLCRPYLDPSLNAQNALSAAAWNSVLYGTRIQHPLPFQPTTLPSILKLTGSIVADLTKFDIFNTIDASLAPSFAPGANEEDVDVILSCKPKGRLFLKSSTDIGNGEGSASVQGLIRNVFGGAETLQGSATFGTRTKQAFNLQFASPLLANPDHTASLSAFVSERDLTTFSSAFESIKGLKAAVSSSVAPGVQHELAYEASVRSLGRLLPDASISMRKLATRPTVKSSFSHTLLRDTRDDPVLPGSGSYLKVVQELAGFGGDTSYYKAEAEVSFGRRWTIPEGLLRHFEPRAGRSESTQPFLKEEPMPVDLPPAPPAPPSLPVSTLTFRSGVLRTFNGAPSLYSDRFQLGGPTCVRMFRLNGLGPKDKIDSLGGDAYWSLGLGTNFDIPRRPEWPLKMHTFVNAGQIVQLDMAKPPKDLPTSLAPLLQPSVSAGFGIVYLQGPLRVELNAGLPLAARRSDSIRKGLQLGVGISFL